MIVRGGLALGVRQALGMAFGIIGVLVSTRILGPTNYGIYATAFGIHTFAVALSQAGIGVFLIRADREVDERVFNTASSLLLLLGCAGAFVETVVVPEFGKILGLGDAMPVLALLACSLPIQLIGTAASARLERALNYSRVAAIELTSQVTYYLVAIPLAFAGAGAWSLATAWVMQQAIGCVYFYIAAAWVPRLGWNQAIVLKILRYAVSYSSATWIWQGKWLVNSLVVGSIFGVDAVGVVTLVIRLIEVLSFAKATAYRISIAAFARVQNDAQKLLTGIAEGMEVQVLGVGVPYVLFGLLGDQIIALFFGSRWSAIMDIYPFVAIGYLTNAVFSLHSSALAVLRKNGPVIVFGMIYLLIFVPSAYALMHLAGLSGYGYAELMALASYAILHLYVRREVGEPGYTLVVAWYVPFALALLIKPLSLWLSLTAFLAAFVWPNNWRRIGYYLAMIGVSRRM